MKVVSIVGMAGAGKSEVARVFEESGFKRVRFGDITDEEVKKRGLTLNEPNERYVRELLREEYGMAAYALLNLPRIDAALKESNVVVDGLYSWEEYLTLKAHFKESFYLVAVCAAPKIRYARLGGRAVRPLTTNEASGRDRAEIENLNKGGPIAMAEFTVVNEGALEDLRKAAREIVTGILSDTGASIGKAKS
ncbi:MAG: AAA family ATPase [Chloroflexota bacterium]